MRVTFWALGAPLLAFALYFLVAGFPAPGHSVNGITGIFAAWLLAGVPITFIYWFVRLVRHAWRG